MLDSRIPQTMELLAQSALQLELSVFCTRFVAGNNSIQIVWQGNSRIDVEMSFVKGEIWIHYSPLTKQAIEVRCNTIEEAVTSIVLWLVENYSKADS